MMYFLLQSKSSRSKLYHAITGTQKVRRMECRTALCGYYIPITDGDEWEMINPEQNKLNCEKCKTVLRKRYRELQKILQLESAPV